MSAKVLVQDLHKRYGSVAAIDGVSFEVASGETFGLIGPNGAGKTTTVECLIGLRQPDEGRIEVCGIDARARPRDVKQRIGAALQTTSLQDKITPREALSLFGALYGTSGSSQQLLDRFGLTEKADRPFDTLSIGQRQKLGLALAFVNDPEIVVLDEPTAGLDPQSRRDLRHDIERMRTDGRTILLTTHDLEEAALLCDRIAIIDRGKVVAAGTPASLTQGSAAVPTVSLSTTPALDAGWLDGIGDLDGLIYDGNAARFRTNHPGRTLRDVLARADSMGAEIVDLHVQRSTLEDVLLELTGSTPRD